MSPGALIHLQSNKLFDNGESSNDSQALSRTGAVLLEVCFLMTGFSFSGLILFALKPVECIM